MTFAQPNAQYLYNDFVYVLKKCIDILGIGLVVVYQDKPVCECCIFCMKAAFVEI